jgi:DNA-binding NtrC family response regulator
MRKRILVGAVRARERLANILAGHDLVFVQTLAEACSVLESQKFDMVLIGTRFDESRMFDLLRYIKADKTLADVPVVCIHGVQGSRATKVVLEGMTLACEALGAAGFHDFINYPKDEAGNVQIRHILESYWKTSDGQ